MFRDLGRMTKGPLSANREVDLSSKIWVLLGPQMRLGQYNNDAQLQRFLRK